MPYRPIQWARQTVEGRQIEADGSRLVDFYAVRLPDPTEAKTPVMLYGTPGMRRFLRVPPQPFERGGMTITPTKGVHALLEIDSTAYGHRLFGISSGYQLFEIVQGQGEDIENGYDPFKAPNPDAVFQVQPDRTRTFSREQADMVPAYDPIQVATDGRRIMWVSDDEVFMYDLHIGGFATVRAPVVADISTLEDLGEDEQDWIGCGWIDGFFILVSRSGQFFHSNFDSEQFDQLDFAWASSNPDDVVGLAILNRRIYLLGSKSIEQWYNYGGADFAFKRDNSVSINIGCASRASIVTNESSITFLGHNGIVYEMQGSRLLGISTETVAYDIDRSIPAKARAFGYTEENHQFYSLSLAFPDGSRRNWTYDHVTGLWHQRGNTDVLCSLSYGSGSAASRKWNLVGLEGHEHIYDMRLDWGFIEDDDPTAEDHRIERECISPVVFANLHRANNPSFHIDIPERDGDPMDEITFAFSDNAGKRWRSPRNHTQKFDEKPFRRKRWNRLGQIRYGRNYRLTTNAKRRVDILGAYIDTEVLPD